MYRLMMLNVLRNLNPVIDISYRETQKPSGLFQSEKWTDVPTYHLVPVARELTPSEISSLRQGLRQSADKGMQLAAQMPRKI